MKKTIAGRLTCAFGTPWADHATEAGCVLCQQFAARLAARVQEVMNAVARNERQRKVKHGNQRQRHLPS